MKPLGLYVHVPFCAKKCPYCSFYSEAYHRATAEEYVSSVIGAMREYSGKGLTADTLYFGGGTPSLLDPKQIACITAAARETFELSGEITMEANPNTLTKARLDAYLKAGVNRLSIGMQSADADELTALGRTHTASRAAQAVYDAEAAGYRDISLDLMLGTPYQTAASLRKTLEFAVNLPITHLSCYMLKTEEGTPYWGSELLAFCADDDMLAGFYLDTVDFLEENGFTQYEISNFAKCGYKSRHNLKYWRCEEYLGFGASAHSFFEGRRYGHPDSISEWLASKGKNPNVTESAAGGTEERIMLGLRLCEGIQVELLNGFPKEKRERFLAKFRQFVKMNLAYFGSHRLGFTKNGFLLSNFLLSELL